MKTEILNIIVPDEGKMLFDGQTYSAKVICATEHLEKWQEVPMAQFEEWKTLEDARLEAQTAEAEAAANPADFEGEDELSATPVEVAPTYRVPNYKQNPTGLDLLN